MYRKAHDLWADSLPFVSSSFCALSIKDNLECTPALETDGSEEVGWKKGIINIWRWVNVLALGSCACGFSQGAQMSPHLLCRTLLVTFLLRVSCTVWWRVRDVKSWGKSEFESTAWSGCDKTDWWAHLLQARQLARQSKKGYGRFLLPRGLFLPIFRPLRSQFTFFTMLLYVYPSVAEQLQEINIHSLFEIPSCTLPFGNLVNIKNTEIHQQIGDRLFLFWVIWWQKTDGWTWMWRQLCAIMYSWEGLNHGFC